MPNREQDLELCQRCHLPVIPPLSTKTHAVFDYIVGALLILVPLFYSEQRDAAVWVPVVIGAILLIQSLMTNYELGAMHLISMPVHLGMDAIAGIVLAASPWVFGFADEVWAPHLIVGLAEIGLALTTRTRRGELTTYSQQSHHHEPV